jgi:hypothetical protein
MPRKEMYTWKRQRCSSSPAVIAARIPKEPTTARNIVSFTVNTVKETRPGVSSEDVLL